MLNLQPFRTFFLSRVSFLWYQMFEQTLNGNFSLRVSINLSPQFQPKPQLLMNLLRQKVSFLIKLFLKKPSERRWRLWTDGYAILYECTALTSWATGPLLSIPTLFITFQNKIYLKIPKHVLMYTPCTSSPIKYRSIQNQKAV